MRPPVKGTAGVGTVWEPGEEAQASYEVAGECIHSLESSGNCSDLRPHCSATQMALSFHTSQSWPRVTCPESSHRDGVEVIHLLPSHLNTQVPGWGDCGVTETGQKCHIHGKPSGNIHEEDRMLLPASGRPPLGGGLLSSQPALSRVTLKIAGLTPDPTHPGRITVTHSWRWSPRP